MIVAFHLHSCIFFSLQKVPCTDISGWAKPIMLTHDNKILLAKAFSDHLKDGKPVLFADVKAVFLSNTEVAEMFSRTYPGVHGKELLKKMYYAARNLSSKYRPYIGPGRRTGT